MPDGRALPQSDGDEEVAEGEATLERRHAAQTGRDHAVMLPAPGRDADGLIRSPPHRVLGSRGRAAQLPLVHLHLQAMVARIERPAGDQKVTTSPLRKRTGVAGVTSREVRRRVALAGGADVADGMSWPSTRMAPMPSSLPSPMGLWAWSENPGPWCRLPATYICRTRNPGTRISLGCASTGAVVDGSRPHDSRTRGAACGRGVTGPSSDRRAAEGSRGRRAIGGRPSGRRRRGAVERSAGGRAVVGVAGLRPSPPVGEPMLPVVVVDTWPAVCPDGCRERAKVARTAIASNTPTMMSSIVGPSQAASGPGHRPRVGLDGYRATMPLWRSVTSPQDANRRDWTGNGHDKRRSHCTLGARSDRMDRTTTPLATLLDGWAVGDASLNEQLAAAIAALMRRGDLTVGTRLPSERDLALSLGVSRTTVVSAYGRLRQDGLIRARQGSGWRVGPGAASVIRRSVGRSVPGRARERRGTHRTGDDSRSHRPRVRGNSRPSGPDAHQAHDGGARGVAGTPRAVRGGGARGPGRHPR